jgi:hypothetical protein
MKMQLLGRISLLVTPAVALVALLGMQSAVVQAQTQSAESAAGPIYATPHVRVTEAVDEHQLVVLPGKVNPMARPPLDRGLVSDAQPITRMHLVLQRSAEQESALEQLLADQQNTASPNYHAWVTPQTFGRQFGPADADVAAVTSWLASQGFQNISVTTGKTAVEFSGNVGQVRSAFHTEIHKFFVDGEEHFANVSVPQIPAALAPVIKGMASLQNFRSRPMLRRVGKFRKNLTTGVTEPLFTFTDVNGTFYGLGPGDFAKIYNVPGTATGASRSIAIVARSNINLQDVCDFRTMFALTPSCPTYQNSNLQIILNGADPGLVSGDEGESDLDVQWAGAVAPAATIKFVATQTTQTDGVDGVSASAFYIVNNNIADVLSQSYGFCEAGADNADQNLLWQQAAAQGITVVVAAGDNGSAGCDDQNSLSTASGGNAVSGAASTPYDVAVGGTDFDDATTQTTFWNATNTSPSQTSAKGYIPEVPWNDTCATAGITGCTAASANLSIVAGSGGASAVYPKPSWQVGFGDATARDIPDVSLFAGTGTVAKSFYIVCESDEDIPGDDGCNLTNFSPTAPFHDFQAVGGTSGSAPSFAGIMALVNQKTGQRQGVANYVLYSLAQAEKATIANCNSNSATPPAATCVFNDVTKSNNAVACAGGSPDCSNKTAGTIGVETTTTGGTTVAFAAETGYDLATGLGSINVANLLNGWASPSRIATTLTLTGPAAPPLNSTQTYSGTLSKTSGTTAPTGLIILEDTSTGAAIDQVALSGSGASYSIKTPFMPAGTYKLIAHYGGDGIYAATDSAPINVSITKLNGTVVVSFVNFDQNGNPILSTGAQSLQYGAPYILRVDVNTPSGSCENVAAVCPTGTVQLFQNTGVPLNDFPKAQTPNATNVATLNDRGFIEDQPIQLPAGTYSITATYSANATTSSYNSNSSSNAVAVIITQAPTITTASSTTSVVSAGGTISLTAIVSSQSNSSLGPTGTVQFRNGTASIGAAVTCTPTGANVNTNVGAFCTATTTTTAAFLIPPSVPLEMPGLRTAPLYASAFAIFAVFLLGLTRVPSQNRRLVLCASLLLLTCVVAGIAGCGGGSGGGGGGGGTTESITAVYSGDTNYSASTSPAIRITVQ